MKNLNFLLLSITLLRFLSNYHALEAFNGYDKKSLDDIDLRTYDSDNDDERKNIYGLTELQRLAIDCDGYATHQEAKDALAYIQKNGKRNPFLQVNEETARQIAKKRFTKTGSLACKQIEILFRQLEEEYAQTLSEQLGRDNF